MPDVHGKVIAYTADIKDVLAKLERIAKANQRIGRNLGRDFGKGAKVAGDSIAKISQSSNFDKFGKTIDGTSASVTKFSQNIKSTNGNLVKFSETTRTNADGTKRVSKSFQDLDKNTVSLGENISRLAKRAALTIPLWLALRGAITGVVSTVKNGFRDIVEFDRILQKLRKNLQGTPQEIQKNFEVAKKSITDFSLASGKSTEDITKAIQRFATVGFDFETALSAGLDATRLSVLLFGEAEETANAFSRGLRVLVSDINDTEKSTRQISEALALTSELYETNAFELKELNGGLEKFAGTAKSMNFTIEETVTLLAALSTRGLNAERAGRLLRTSTQKLEQNLSKLGKVLGVSVNPEVDRTFDVFVRVTNAIADLQNEAGTITPAVSEAIAELFGGVRGGEAVRDLIADMANVNKAFAEFANKKADITKFRRDFQEMNDTVFRQVEIMRNLNKETGKAFVTGLVGGENFKDSLKSINSRLETLQKNAKGIGQAIGQAFAGAGTVPGVLGIKFFDAKRDAARAAEELGEEITKGLLGELSDVELKDLVVKLTKIDLDSSNISEQSLTQLGKQLSKQLSDEDISAPVEIQAKQKEGQVQFEKDRQETAEALVAAELKRLQAIGATNSELLKAEDVYKRLLKIDEEDKDVLQRRLDLERAIKEEKRLQSRLGSESIKLFRIAQEQGTDIASKIGDVLSGDIDFSTFVRRGGEAVDIFKKEFADAFEQQQALAFFQGNRVPGATGIRGGAGIAIREEGIRSPLDRASLLLQARREGVTAPITTRTAGATANVQQTNHITNNFNVRATSQEEAVDAFMKASGDPRIQKRLAQMLSGTNQINNL